MKWLCLALLLAGCADDPPRLFSLEEEADLRVRCSQGCVLVPTPVLQKLLMERWDRGL